MCRHYAIATNSSRAPRVDRVERDEFGRCDAQRPTATLNRSSRYGHPQRRRPQPWTRCIKARRRAWTCPCVRTKEGSLRRPRTPVRAAATTKLSPQSDVLLGIAFSPVRAISKRHPSESTQRVRNTCTGNPYVPRALGDHDAYIGKRRCFLNAPRRLHVDERGLCAAASRRTRPSAIDGVAGERPSATGRKRTPRRSRSA
jgi:hypothetical protein